MTYDETEIEYNPRIVCAANRLSTGAIIIGTRHFSVTMNQNFYGYLAAAISDDPGITEEELKDSYRRSEQGFIDQHGKFYNRYEAWKIAESNNQIIERVGGDTRNGGCLFSENLY